MAAHKTTITNVMQTRNNNVAVARKLARQMWGEIQHQTKLADGVWSFDTAGHGGYIVDTDIYPELKEWNTPVACYKNSCRGYVNEQHFAAFEEDSDWAIAEWMLFDTIITPKVMKNSLHIENMTFDEWKDRRREMVKGTLQRWYPKYATDERFAEAFC